MVKVDERGAIMPLALGPRIRDAYTRTGCGEKMVIAG